MWLGSRGSGDPPPPSIHRRLQNTDSVHKLPPTPRHWAKEVHAIFPTEIKSQSPSHEAPCQKKVTLQREEAMSLVHGDGGIFEASSLAPGTEVRSNGLRKTRKYPHALAPSGAPLLRRQISPRARTL